jgi:hypothetical protein
MVYNREKSRLWNDRWMQKQKEKGLCIFCKNKKLEHSNLCERHYFINIAASLGDAKLAEAIQELFYAQECKCYLTGEPLVLGVNAGVDHILPKSKYGGDIQNSHNIRWIDRRINAMKGTLTATEFVELCYKVVNTLGEVNNEKE